MHSPTYKHGKDTKEMQIFFPYAFRSLPYIRFIAVAFQSEEEVLWRRNPSLTYFWQTGLGSAPGWSLPKILYTGA